MATLSSTEKRAFIRPVQIFGLLLLFPFLWGWFRLAGGWDWWRGWAYLALMVLTQAVSGVLLSRSDPELLRRRAEFGKGTPVWDFVMLGGFGVALLAGLGVAAWEAGRMTGTNLPAWLWPTGAGLFLTGSILLHRAMAVNTHFEKTARIQHDRNHQVVDTGPYSVVRHPGYVGVLAAFGLAPPLLLGSRWALIPGVVSMAFLVARTALEDRMLRARLEGYPDYANRVRNRLIPGVW